ncbi:hypothetical protein [Paracoccus alkanivorans]|uniref:Porin n=1 Tax=Paracoccus alkanivorans TaxID=2116655 RepID=A0A3M0MGF3_9RHOB|nr:hypothetical protein [Paracoccus alkanivorans]RMC35444.1 hypothetical protein C9E81_09420 [Paracoccus alkanivorans]
MKYDYGILGAQASHVLFKGKRAVGLRYRRDTTGHQARAQGNAGQHGIGTADGLQGVGQSMQDRINFIIDDRPKDKNNFGIGFTATAPYDADRTREEKP